MADPRAPQAPFAMPKGATSTSLVDRVAAAMRYVVSGDTGWFGPGVPMAPVADQPTDGTAGRAFDYPVSINMRTAPRSGETVTFATMRALADGYDLLRLVIETRKDQFGKLKWKLRRKDEGEDDASVKAATAFMQRPDGEHSFDDWLRMLIEEMLVIDAVAIYPRMNQGGGLYALELVDGATIKRVLDVTGRTPLPPEPAYQQVLHGMPAINYTRDEMLLRMRNLRVSRVYGYSPVEQIIITVNIALRRQVGQLSYYTEGNTPNLIFTTPPEWGPEQIHQFQSQWDSLTSEGQTKHRTLFVPAGVAPHDTKAGALKDEFDEWLARVVCYAFSVPPSAFVKQVNRATSESAHQQSIEEGLAPLQRWIALVINDCIAGAMGLPDVEFIWDEEEAVDPLVAAQIAQIYVAEGVITADEARADLGRSPLTAAQKEEIAPTPAPALLPATPKAPPFAATKIVKKNSLTQRSISAPY